MEILITDPLAQRLITAIHKGDTDALRQLLDDTPEACRARILEEGRDGKVGRRTLLHIATDWPGHFPNVTRTISLLIERGADPNALMIGGNAEERPLHWAASSNDVIAIDALLDGGADIEGSGAIFTNGSAMSDAVIFAQWDAARRLLERGSTTTLTQAAALGLMNRVAAFFEQEPQPPSEQITAALWHGCRGGQLQVAQYLVERGADVNWAGWDQMAPLDCAVKSGDEALMAWLREHGAKQAAATAH